MCTAFSFVFLRALISISRGILPSGISVASLMVPSMFKTWCSCYFLHQSCSTLNKFLVMSGSPTTGMVRNSFGYTLRTLILHFFMLLYISDQTGFLILVLAVFKVSRLKLIGLKHASFSSSVCSAFQCDFVLDVYGARRA